MCKCIPGCFRAYLTFRRLRVAENCSLSDLRCQGQNWGWWRRWKVRRGILERKELQKEQTSDSEPKLCPNLGQLVQGDPSESTERQQLEAERTDQRSELSTTGEKGG